MVRISTSKSLTMYFSPKSFFLELLVEPFNFLILSFTEQVNFILSRSVPKLVNNVYQTFKLIIERNDVDKFIIKMDKTRLFSNKQDYFHEISSL